MKNRLAKLFSVILVIAMMTGTLPIRQAVFAAENETATETEAANDDKKGEDEVKETDSKPSQVSKPDSEASKESPKESEPAKKQETEATEKESESTKKQETEAAESNETKETEDGEVVESERSKSENHSVKPKDATTNITTVSLTLDEPVAGKPGDYTADFPAGANYTSSNYDPTDFGWYKNGIAWKDINIMNNPHLNPSSGTFLENHQYKAIIYLKPKSGYQFTSSTTAKVNDKTADTSLSDDGYLVVEYTFPKLKNYIKSVSITVNAPVPGAKPDYEPVVPSDAKYHVNKYTSAKNYTKGVMWYDMTTSTVLDPDSSVFLSGHRYQVSIVLESNSYDYYFSNSPNVLLNGETVPMGSEDHTVALTVSYTFPATLTYADITLDVPAIGSKPDYTAEFPSGAKYYTQNNNDNFILNDILWYDVTTSEALTPNSTVFVPGHRYQVCIYLSAEDGFAFDSSTAATINDQDAETSVNGKKLCVSFTFPKLPNTYTFTIGTSAYYYDLDDNLKTDLSGNCGTVTLSKPTAQQGEEVTISVTPKNGYTLKKVVLHTSQNGEEDITTAMKFTVGTVQPTIYVYFQELPPVIPICVDINCYDEKNGADIKDGSVYVSLNGSTEYVAGTNGISISVNSNEWFTLTAGVKSGDYTFVGWYSGKIGTVGVNLISNNATISVKISSDKTYYAAFTTPKTEIKSLTFTSDKVPVAGKTIEECLPTVTVAETGVSVGATRVSWLDMYGFSLPAGHVFTEGEQVRLNVNFIVNKAYQLASNISDHTTLNGVQPTSIDTYKSEFYVVYTVTKEAVLGETFVVGDYNYAITNANTDGTGTVTLTGVVNNTSSVSISSTVVINLNTYKVNRIGAKAFYGDKTIKTLSIGANVAVIDGSAFYGCSNLTTVSGGKGLKTIGASAFAMCSKLKSFSIASPVLSKIGTYAFNKDSKLKTISIKNTTKLTKSGVKKSLKGSKVKTVKVKKSKVKKYKKYFKKSNSGRSVKVKK